MLKRVTIGLLVAAVVTLGAVGVALADDSTPPANGALPNGGGRWMASPHGGRGGQHGALAGTIAELADSQGMTLEEVVDALIAPAIERIQQAVDDGDITQEEADERIEQIEARLLEALESGSGFGPRPGGFPGRQNSMWGGRGMRSPVTTDL